MRWFFSWLTVLATPLLAPSAFGASMERLIYDMSDTTLTLSSPLFTPVVIPKGTFTGETDIVYTSDGNGHVLDGPLVLEKMTMMGMLDVSTVTAFGPFTATGPAQGQLDAPVDGTLSGSNGTTGAGGTISFGAPATFSGSTTITCGPSGSPICTAIKATPTATFSGMGSAVPPNLMLGSIHGDFSNFGFALGLGSVSSVLTIDLALGGQVTSMVALPEPGSALLLGSGLAGLVALRRRRARP